MSDKRSYRRFSFVKKITLRFDRSPQEPVEGRVLEISFTGMSLFLKEEINTDGLVGTALDFDLANTVEQHFTGRARVVYVKKQRLYAEEGSKIGLEFTGVDKQAVLSIIDRLEAEIMAEVRKRSRMPRRNIGEF